MPEVGSELYRLINVGGGDAAAFLQGQLTQDIGLLADGTSLPAAWCDARGRVIVTMRLLLLPESIGLAVPAGIAQDVCDRLTRFRLRADVDLTIRGDDWHCVAVSGTSATDAARAIESRLHGDVVMLGHQPDPSFAEICGPAEAVAAMTGGVELSAEQWANRLIHAGIPRIDATNSEKFTPQMLNLDRLGAVSFSKGCYTGQEVVARTQHLGTSKRRLMHYRCELPTIAVGDKLQELGNNVGEVVNIAGADLLAVTPVALYAQTLHINGVIAKPVALPY
jgi:folate-binding protein YgfZ